ncbi:MAG: NAD(P)H-dependent oxidoreductase [Erysipelotrichaceae bacterium]
MSILFVNSTLRDDSRTLLLANKYLERLDDEIIRLDLAKCKVEPLNNKSLAKYLKDVPQKNFADKMYDYAKQFAESEVIVIAAPFYNFSFPAVLHDYLEMVCCQGVTFDLDQNGNYVSLCKAKKLIYITTAGGYIPEEDHAFGYIEQLCQQFFKIADVRYIKADGIDLVGNDCDKILADAIDDF